MMDAELNATAMSNMKDGGSNDKPHLQNSKTPDLQAPVRADNTCEGASTEETCFSEQISTEDTELPSAVDVSKTADFSVESNLQTNPKDGSNKAVSGCKPGRMDKDEPKPQCSLSPPSMESSTVYEVSQSFTSMSRSRGNHKTTHDATEPDREDICAAILLACLFCHPLECLLAIMRGCNECFWSLCSCLCGCEPTTLQPLLDVTQNCNLCCCLDVCNCLCDCALCDICLQATECLDLAMEISQMLYH